MNQPKIILGLIIIVTTFTILVFYENEQKNNRLKTSVLVIGQNEFKVELARTEQELEKGLGSRKALAANEGMFFVFNKSDYWGIWMKDMLIPVDIIWLDEKLTIVDLKENVSPQTYPAVFQPIKPAYYVLELKAGTLTEKNIKKEDQIKLSSSIVKALP